MSETNSESADSANLCNRSAATSEAVLLAHISQRLAALEIQIGKSIEGSLSQPSALLEILRIILGGWPAFGLVFLLLFHSPVRDALQAVPEKVRSAQEIGLLGVSLKSTLRTEAFRAGAEGLSETLPSLSPEAIEFLLRTERNSRYSLISYSNNKDGNIDKIWFPSEREFTLISELEQKGLATINSISSGSVKQGVPGARAVVADFKSRYPGKASVSFGAMSREGWEPQTIVSADVISDFQIEWGTTELGKSAIEVIIRTVATALAPKPDERTKDN